METAICPNVQDGVLLKKVIMKMSTNFAVVDLPRGSIDMAGVIEKFHDLIHDGVIWKTIKRLAEKLRRFYPFSQRSMLTAAV
jgi:hypothetical protein